MKPIIFSTPMVQAILDGKKTQTRRVIKPQPAKEATQFERFIETVDCGLEARFGSKNSSAVCDRKPQYKPGDILWVRETWRDRWGMAYANYGTGNAYPIDDVREIEYKAGGNGFFMHGCNLCPDEPTVKWGEWSKWRPSIFMPREAARIFLRVTNVRVERLQDITSEQAKNEGVDLNSGTPFPKSTARDCHGAKEGLSMYQSKFVILWNSTIKKQDLDQYGWESNPWVWVVVFEKIIKEEAERLEGMK